MVCMCTHDEDVLNAKTVFFVHAVITILPDSFLDICKRMRVGVGFSSINTQHKKQERTEQQLSNSHTTKTQKQRAQPENA